MFYNVLNTIRREYFQKYFPITCHLKMRQNKFCSKHAIYLLMHAYRFTGVV